VDKWEGAAYNEIKSAMEIASKEERLCSLPKGVWQPIFV
jgi:hypothetical protein